MGARPLINACGIYTDLGGSRLSPAVWAAMTESNGRFVRMAELLESSGRIIARHTGAETARVTPGAAASITLMVAAAMTGTDGEAGERLPDTADLRNEIVLQRPHRYKYDRQIRMTGAKLVLAGTERAATRSDLEGAIGPRTAALFCPGHLEGLPDTVPLETLVELGRARGIPLLVDAAYLCWPLDGLTRFVAAGADLVCYSAKYFGGPNAGGFITGSSAMIDAVMANNFLRYDSGPFRTFGRPYKLDRQTVVGVVVALEEWLAQDHAERLDRSRRLVVRLAEAIESASGIRTAARCFTMDERLVPEPVNALVLELDPGHRSSASAVAERLAQGDPSIACVVVPDMLIFCVDVLEEEEVDLIARRLVAVLTS
jgi:L-seryl-tRNA(Ser) seleniumtransferase